jgi:hypothetical protein
MANDDYSSRSAYELQFEGSQLYAFPSMVWKVWAPSRFKFFIRLMMQNRIWTVDRLLLREWPNDYFYPLCRWNLETSCHLFQECTTSCQIWTEVSNWAKVPAFHPSTWRLIKSTEDGCQDLSVGNNLSTAQAKGVRSLSIPCWTIWKERNFRIFEGKERLASSLVSEI